MIPRVFVSSTFYDLKFLREDLANFIKNYNFDPVLFEHGDVGYIYGENLDKSCYKEMQNADMVILIIGGRYGSAASGEEEFKEYLSVTRKEFNTAVAENIPIYAFVEQNVLSEYKMFIENKDIFEKGSVPFKFVATESINVFYFIEAIYMLKYVPVTPFSEAQDIKNFLKKQWADMFKQYLLYLKNEKKNETVLDLVNRLDKLACELNIMIQKNSEKIIGEQTEELQSVIQEQRTESVESIIANSIKLVMRPKEGIAIRNIISKLADNITEGNRKNILNKLSSQDPKNINEVQDLLQNDSDEIFMGNVKEEIGLLLHSNKIQAIDSALVLRQWQNTQDPFVIAKAMNIEICFVDVDLSVMRGYSYHCNNDKMVIKINSNLSEEEQKHVCAHELGHLVGEHTGENYYKYNDSDREYYANLFAVSLLYLYNRFESGKDILDLSSYALKTILETG